MEGVGSDAHSSTSDPFGQVELSRIQTRDDALESDDFVVPNSYSFVAEDCSSSVDSLEGTEEVALQGADANGSASDAEEGLEVEEPLPNQWQGPFYVYLCLLEERYHAQNVKF